jgi:hypothetical protein
MMNMMESTPRLIEQGVRNYMHVVLHKCYDQRVRWYSIGLNLGVLFVFLGIVGLSLWYGHSKKLSPQERQQKLMRDQHTVLTKIREFQSNKQLQQERLSNLVRRVEPVTNVSRMGQVIEPNLAPQSTLLNQEPHVDLMYSMTMDR